jgi:O-antigen/teichoic acid export membrane protein
MSDIPPQKPEYNLTTTIFRNTGFITAGTIVLKAVNFLFGIYVVRQLGDFRFGQYSIVLAFVGIFSIFAELGMSQYVMREMARDRSKIRVYFWNLVALRVLLALIGMLIIPIAGNAVGYSQEIVFGILIYTSSFILAAFSVPLGSVLAADERLGINTIANVVGQLFFHHSGKHIFIQRDELRLVDYCQFAEPASQNRYCYLDNPPPAYLRFTIPIGS